MTIKRIRREGYQRKREFHEQNDNKKPNDKSRQDEVLKLLNFMLRK